MVIFPATMTTSHSPANYALGNTDAEHERLIRQAARVAPTTERFFREAGVGSGQRVLDIGSGVGDVAMLAARLVGPSGEVVGIERDPRSIVRARARVTEAGLRNVSFVQSDVSQIQAASPSTLPSAVSYSCGYLILFPLCARCLNKFAPGESLLSRSRIGRRFLHFWRPYHFGLRQLH